MENLKDKKTDELREIAAGLEIEGASAMKKPDLLAAIAASQAPAAETPAADPDPEPAPSPPAGPDPEPPAADPAPEGGEGAYDPASGQVVETLPGPESNPTPPRRPTPSQAWRSFLESVGETLTPDEQDAVTTLERHGWKIFFNAKIEDCQERSFKRSFRNEGRYVITVARKDLKG